MNFTVIAYTNPAATASSIATIDCGTNKCVPGDSGITSWGPGAAASAVTCKPADGYKCDKPKFKLNRALINLPMINQTADVIHQSVDLGECKMVSDPIEGEILYLPRE